MKPVLFIGVAAPKSMPNVPVIIRFAAPLLIGGLLGAALGYFGQCTSGTCPLTSTWWRGALYGASLGLFIAMSGRSS